MRFAVTQILKENNIVLSFDQLELITREVIKLYRQHLKVCLTNDSEPDGLDKFVVEIAEQVQKGIYEPPQRLTEVNDIGCRRLLNEVCVTSIRMRRLQQWHEQYVRKCNDGGTRAYALQLILDAVNSADSTFSLFKNSLSEQIERINALVADYVKQTGRKDNPRWYARQSRCKPSKQFNKYAF